MRSNAPLSVAIGIIRNGDDQVLLSRRSTVSDHAGLWEFPGGKVRTHEALKDALARELLEELYLTVEVARPLIKIQYEYEKYAVLLDVWSIDLWRSDLLATNDRHGREGQEIAWVDIADLHLYEFPSATKAIIRILQRPDFYLICPEPEARDNHYIKKFDACLAAGVRLFQLRFGDESRYDKHQTLIDELFGLCQKAGAKLLINSSPEYAINASVHGIHLNSKRLMQLDKPLSDRDFTVAASCHDRCELERAGHLQVDFAVLSPLRRTKNYPYKKPLGWKMFNHLVKSPAIPVYALGGMHANDIQKSIKKGGQGIAVMSGVWNSGCLEEAVFGYMNSSPHWTQNKVTKSHA